MDETPARILPFDRLAPSAADPGTAAASPPGSTSEAERHRYWAQVCALRAERQALAG